MLFFTLKKFLCRLNDHELPNEFILHNLYPLYQELIVNSNQWQYNKLNKKCIFF